MGFLDNKETQARADATRLRAAEATVRVAEDTQQRGRAHEAADGDAQLGKRVDGLAARHDTQVDELTRCWEARHTDEDEAQSLLLSGEELREGARRADSEAAAEREETQEQVTALRDALAEERAQREERGAATDEGLGRTDARLEQALREREQTLQIVHRALEQHSCGLEAVQAHVDMVHAEVRESDMAQTAECMLLQVSDLPCNIRREGGQSLVIGGSSLVILEGREGNPL